LESNLLRSVKAAKLPGADWPNREYSSSIHADGLDWHVQRTVNSNPARPRLLLLHGTGSSTHSWRGLLPLLANDFEVLAPDLPGHGFTLGAKADSLSLPGMSRAIAGLLKATGFQPDVLVGHSAGAAVLLRMVLDGRQSPHLLIGLNAALLPFGGSLAKAFRPLAGLCASIPLLPGLFAARARQAGSVERLIANTGSHIPQQGIEDYRQLLGNEAHVAATLRMMASWDLDSLLPDATRSPPPLCLIVGDADRTVPPAQADRVQRILPSTRVVRLPGLGHLAHEEEPALLAKTIRQLAMAGAQ